MWTSPSTRPAVRPAPSPVSARHPHGRVRGGAFVSCGRDSAHSQETVADSTGREHARCIKCGACSALSREQRALSGAHAQANVRCDGAHTARTRRAAPHTSTTRAHNGIHNSPSTGVVWHLHRTRRRRRTRRRQRPTHTPPAQQPRRPHSSHIARTAATSPAQEGTHRVKLHFFKLPFFFPVRGHFCAWSEDAIWGCRGGVVGWEGALFARPFARLCARGAKGALCGRKARCALVRTSRRIAGPSACKRALNRGTCYTHVELAVRARFETRPQPRSRSFERALNAL